MIVAESDFDPGSTSNKGAMGLGQLMPDEAKELHLNNPYDVEQNLYGSVVCLRQHLDRFADPSAPGGAMSFEQMRLALAAYNAGPGAVRKYKGIPPYRETQGYVRRIEKLYRQLCGEQ
jgi:soluble lytic murein transglycosylase-like protein